VIDGIPSTDDIVVPGLVGVYVAIVVFFRPEAKLPQIPTIVLFPVDNIVPLVSGVLQLFFSCLWREANAASGEKLRMGESDDIVVSGVFVVISLNRGGSTKYFICSFARWTYYCSIVRDSSLASLKDWRTGLNLSSFSMTSIVDLLSTAGAALPKGRLVLLAF
jgi:hypothetical protein